MFSRVNLRSRLLVLSALVGLVSPFGAVTAGTATAPGWTVDAPDWDALPGDAYRITGATGPDGRTLALTVDEDARVLGFHVTVDAGRLDFRVDGRFVHAFRDGATDVPFDVALAPGASHVLTWTFVAHAPDAAAELALAGAVPTRAPVVADVPALVHGCVLPDLAFDVVHALPVDAHALDVTVDGEPVDVDVTHRISGERVRSTVSAALPAGLADGEHALDVRVTTPDGVVHELADAVFRTLVDVALQATPREWAYDLTPTIRLDALVCEEAIAGVTLTVDGVPADVHPDLRVSRDGAATFTRPLAFGEAHTYRFDVTLVDDRVLVFEERFREGLDVVEFDVPAGVLAWGDVHLGRALALPGHPVVLGDALPYGAATVAVPTTGAHARAVYAPMDVACGWANGVAACAPHSGNAPGFLPHEWPNAELTLTTATGEVTLPYAGQWAAAAHESRMPALHAPDVGGLEAPLPRHALAPFGLTDA